MKRYLRIAAWTILAAAPTALAADLVTPESFVGASTYASCKLLNISASPLTAQVQVYGLGKGC